MKRRLILLVLLALCATVSCGAPNTQTHESVLAEDPATVADYRIKVKESFAIKAIESEHQQDVEAARQAFEADLQQGQLDAYYQLPSFSILIAAGSEGSYFKADELSKLDQTGAVFAMAVIYNSPPPAGAPPPGPAPGPPPANPQIFRGQLSNQRFHFAGKYQISPQNTTYLISLDSNLRTQILKGQLTAGAKGNQFTPPAQLSAGSEGSYLDSLPLPEPVSLDALKSQLARYQKAIDNHRSQGAEFKRQVGALRFVGPADGAPVARSELFARLIHAYPEELGYDMNLLDGLPPDIHGTRSDELLANYKSRYERDCGTPPPDSGQLAPPQREAADALVPPGFQSPELDQVLAALPAFAAELERQRKDPLPARYRGYLALLARYQASHPQVFKDKHYQDPYRAPDCVKR